MPSHKVRCKLFAAFALVALIFNSVDSVLPTATAQSSPFSATLTTSVSTVAPGEAITASWSGTPSPSGSDWIGLFKQGDVTENYLDYRYNSGAQTSGQVSFTAPSQNGNYVFRYLLDGGFTRTVESNMVSVSGGFNPPPPPPPTPTPSPFPGPVIPVNFPMTLRVDESFGVSHPDQIIDFTLAGSLPSGNYRMTGPNGNEVLWQQLSGNRIAVRVEGGLPANGSKTWTLNQAMPGSPSTANAVQVSRPGNLYEITNGLTGVRVIMGLQSGRSLAPIQGIHHRDGTWTATGPNNLSPSPSSVSVNFVEWGPLKTTIRVSYNVSGGTYTSTISVEAGQPSILIEEDANNVDVSYKMNIASSLHPNQARYMGGGADTVEDGHYQNGSLYTAYNPDYRNEEAFVNLPFARQDIYAGGSGFPRLLTRHDVSPINTGHYWQFYDTGAGGGANLLGIFQGPSSRVLGAHMSGVRIHSVSRDDTAINLMIERRGWDNVVFNRNRFAWAIFTGTKGDLGAPTSVQTIKKQMNIHSGFNLNKIYRYQWTYPDPSGGTRGIYMSASAARSIITRLRADTNDLGSCEGYSGYLYCQVPEFRDLWAALKDTSGAQTRAYVATLVDRSRTRLNTLVNDHGTYVMPQNGDMFYWHASKNLSAEAMSLNLLMILAEAYPGTLSAGDRDTMKKLTVLYGEILADDDFIPLEKSWVGTSYEHNLPLGTQNMPVQFMQARRLYALMLADHPGFASRAAAVPSGALTSLRNNLNEWGAPAGSTNYIGAGGEPIINLLQQMKNSGVADAFASEPRLGKFGEFYMNMMTPPQARFGGWRKVVAFGGGSTTNEGTGLIGQVATCLRSVNDTLSEQLMKAWRLLGGSISAFNVSGIFKIDDTLPDRAIILGDAHINGYYSVLRHGWDQPYETAAWLINGDWYRDHAEYDLGSTVIYARGVPISLHFGSLYSPSVPGGWMHSLVLDESKLAAPWNSESGHDLSPCCGQYGNRVNQKVTASFLTQGSGFAKAVGSYDMNGEGTWTRALYDYRDVASEPAIRIRDTFGGGWDGKSKIMSLNLMAEGAVRMPDGSIVTPPTRGITRNEGSGMPTVGTVKSFGAGVSNLRFSGQEAMDFDVFIISQTGGELYIGNWGHDWAYQRELGEYSSTNGGASFEERQHILRVRSTGEFDVVIVPYPKGQRPGDLNVSGSSSNLTLTMNGRSRPLEN